MQTATQLHRLSSASVSRSTVFLICIFALVAGCRTKTETKPSVNRDTDGVVQTEEVVFWHFWGGQDRAVVDHIVEKFHQSQDRYRVRAIAMPGNNLQAKLFLSVAGGDPPDLVNQDDPVLADWAQRGVIEPFSNFAREHDIEAVEEQLFPAALKMSTVDGKLWGLCNGLDIRALYYNQTALDKAGLTFPHSTAELDSIAEHFAPPLDVAAGGRLPRTVGFLPDTRRLWAWAPVFGGGFYDDQSRRPTIDSDQNRAALKWMSDYRHRYGSDNLAAFRQGDQSLPGKTFPLLPIGPDEDVGRYVVMMDGQWRVRDIAAFEKKRRAAGGKSLQFGVCPLPPPDHGEGRSNAGWVNGNFFVVPAGAKCGEGAWAFAKFWIGIHDPNEAAQWYADGGWIPVTRDVVESPVFKKQLTVTPLLVPFVELAQSPHQFPTPVVPGAAFFKRTIDALAYDAMMTPMNLGEIDARVKQVQLEIDQRMSSLTP